MEQVFHNNGLEKVSGIIERVTFHGEKTGWSVIKVAPFRSSMSTITVIVHQIKVFAGASMDFYGSWSTHPKYGEQFKAEKVVEKRPSSAAALEKYLGSGLIKGVGPKTAKKIVKHFGARTLEVFESSIDELLKVPSIAERKLEAIRDSWEEHKLIRDLVIFLQTHGVSTLFAVKIFKAYGEKSIENISHNPYLLARDIYGIGFFSADRIALSIGFDIHGKERLAAAISHELSSAREDGHCFLTKEQICERVKKLINIDSDTLIGERIAFLLTEKEIIRCELNFSNELLEVYYSKSLYFAEKKAAECIKKKLSEIVIFEEERARIWLSKYCKVSKLELSEEQFESVLGIAKHPLSILTGGPGSGKTTTTKSLVALLEAMGKDVLLASPTGRAAQRMTEVIGMEAKTIHRLLEFDPARATFKRDENNPLDCNFLIVDESSMLDIQLASALLRAVAPAAQVLFIGDPDQLPSVGPGAFLKNLIELKDLIPSFELKKIFRQAGESLIIRYSHDINRGKIPLIPSPIEDPKVWENSVDCLFVDSEHASQKEINFLRRFKNFLESTKDSEGTHLIEAANEKKLSQFAASRVQLERKMGEASLSVEEDEQKEHESIFSVPQELLHADFARLAKGGPALMELKAVLKSVHPHSSLHSGLSAIDTITRLYSHSLPKYLGAADAEIQVLTPLVKGPLGANKLNQRIQEVVNPPHEQKEQIVLGEKIFRIADRVIQTRNNYDLNVFNGDIGKIQNIDAGAMELEVFYREKNELIQYKRDDLSELNLAYSITIHKSQGSEFAGVIIPLFSQHYVMLYRNLIYTALTRAKKIAVFVGSRRALASAVRNVDNKKRQTGLLSFLSN